MPVAEAAAVGEQHAAAAGRDRLGAQAGNQLDTFRLPCVARVDEGGLRRLISQQHPLGQGRAFVRRFGLVADQRDGAGESRAAQRLGRAAAGLACADDEDAFGVGHRGA